LIQSSTRSPRALHNRGNACRGDGASISRNLGGDAIEPMVATYHRRMPEPPEPTTYRDMPATVGVCEWFRVVERLGVEG
jgi:hypothetical protein